MFIIAAESVETDLLDNMYFEEEDFSVSQSYLFYREEFLNFFMWRKETQEN